MWDVCCQWLASVCYHSQYVDKVANFKVSKDSEVVQNSQNVVV